ncbi:MAG: WYL domain-containing protein [Propionibacteriaceae bacterium]|nr:WYL domain-containing protein [Propionibacteriaceae bacterium]
MSARVEERLLNLTIALLETTRPLTKEEIFDQVEGYSQGDDEAISRKFERDKKDLRDMGITIQSTGGGNKAKAKKKPRGEDGEDDWDSSGGGKESTIKEGYRILAQDYYLPEMDLTAEESRIVALATSIIAEPLITDGVKHALTKLRAVGDQGVADVPSYMVAEVTTDGPNFDVLHDAIATRTCVEFTYNDTPRKVHGWKITQRSGFSYLLGYDTTAGQRTYKISRIQGSVTKVGEAGAYDPVSPKAISDLAASLEGPEPTHSVRVALKEFTAGHLRRRGEIVEGQAPQGYELVEIRYGRLDEIVSALCEVGPHALVMEPGEVRDGVLQQLHAIAGGCHE